MGNNINIGGQSYSKAQLNYKLYQIDKTYGDGDGKVTKAEIQQAEKTAKANGDNSVDQFCSSLLNTNNNATSFDNLIKIAQAGDGLSYEKNSYTKGNGTASDGAIDGTNVGAIFKNMGNNKTSTPVASDLTDKKKMEALITAASSGQSNCTPQQLKDLSDKLGKMDPKASLDQMLGATSDADQATSLFGRLKAGGFTTIGEAKNALDAIIQGKSGSNMDALDTANGGTVDQYITTDDADKFAQNQASNNTASQAYNSSNATPQTALQSGAAGVYSKVSTEDGMTTTDLYKMNPDGSMTTTSTVTAGGKTSSVTTTTTDKTGHTTGATQTYGDDGKVTATTGIDKTGDKAAIPSDATPSNSADPKTPGDKYVPAADLKDGDAGVYKKVDPAEDGVINTTLYKKNADGSITQTQITQNIGDDGKPTGDPTGVTTTTTSADGKTMTGTMTTTQSDGTKKVSDINNTDVPKPSIPDDATPPKTPGDSGAPTDSSGLKAGQGDGKGLRGADNLYIMNDNDTIWSIATKELKQANSGKDPTTDQIQSVVTKIEQENNISDEQAKHLSAGKQLKLSDIYSLQAFSS